MTRVTMGDFEDQIWSHGRAYLSTGSWEGSDATYRTSTYRSPLGIVEVYEHLGRNSIVSMRFIHNGLDYMRRWETSWGDKTIARLAREFIQEVTNA